MGVTGVTTGEFLAVTTGSLDLALGAGGRGIIPRGRVTDLLEGPSLREEGSLLRPVGANLCLLAFRVTIVLFG